MVSSAIAKGPWRPTEDRDGTQAPAEERRSVPSEPTLWGARSRGIEVTAPVSKAGVGGDASGARLNWAAIAVSLVKPNSRPPAGRGKLELII